MRKSTANSRSGVSELEIAKVPFRLDGALVARTKLEADAAVIGVALLRLLKGSSKDRSWEQAGICQGVTRWGKR